MRPMPDDKLWVVAFDGGKALFLENKGFYDAPDLQLVSKHDNDNPPDREQTTDAPGRLQDAGSGSKGNMNLGEGLAHGRSSVQQTDRHEMEKRRFVDRMIERLNEEARKDTFDHILLIAADKALGEAREEYSDKLKGKIIAEEPANVVNEPIDKLESRVKSLLAELIDEPRPSHRDLTGPGRG
ncbi:host attachment protein [Marinicauda algicola]|uniref:Host attachment protein n=1 Tax=Marinicauda algicola TaxID=2029849 RepID=A0A4V3RY64_9PROT|nr:host attachment family protein [Marinicauda algicola]TGY89179.1 host attachment protein [Marinicauda algicola]